MIKWCEDCYVRIAEPAIRWCALCMGRSIADFQRKLDVCADVDAEPA
jgi:hypothetical protein